MAPSANGAVKKRMPSAPSTPCSIGVLPSASVGWIAIASPAAIGMLSGNGPLTSSVPVSLVTVTGLLVATARQLEPPAGASTRRT